MERRIAIWTEWAWSQGLVTCPKSQEAWADFLLKVLKSRFPNSRIHKGRATQKLNDEIGRILKILKYGGRQPADIPPLRLESLQKSVTEIVKQL
jgi:hypothetical protein